MARRIKVATFNVEWMINLFVPGRAQLLRRPNNRTAGLGQRPQDPMGVANRIASVIRAMDPDILGICEGPPKKSQMDAFVRDCLANDYHVFSMEDGPQSVHALVHRRLDNGLAVSQVPPSHGVFGRLRTARTYYRFGDHKKPSTARFTRLPVILRLERRGRVTELVVAHTKSKISSLRSANEWRRRSRAQIIDAINSRQKLSIEMDVLRKYIAHCLWSQRSEAVIVMGDLNDGVTRDVVDTNYLLHSIVHELRGAFHHEVALMRHVLDSRQLQRKAQAWTCAFSDPAHGGDEVRVLLDHILFSPACVNGGPMTFVPGSGLVEHAAFDAHVQGAGGRRDHRPSDHRPLSALFELS